MPNKCAVVGCRVGYSGGPRKALISLPKEVFSTGKVD